MAWEIEASEQVTRWLMDISDEDFAKIAPALDLLAEHGPSLGRPVVDRIKSQVQNMKEVRSAGGNLRIIFAFDPERKAILLIGGDKTGQWNAWYQQNIPKAEELLARHLSGEKI